MAAFGFFALAAQAGCDGASFHSPGEDRTGWYLQICNFCWNMTQTIPPLDPPDDPEAPDDPAARDNPHR